MSALCGADCNNCYLKQDCQGCIVANQNNKSKCVYGCCYKIGGKEKFDEYKKQVISEVNGLNIQNMDKITDLNLLKGFYVNLEYTLPNGQTVKLLNDNDVYLGTQIEIPNSERCYGVVADDNYILIAEYGCNGDNAKIIVYKHR